MQATEFFKALSDATRLQIVQLLSSQPKMCVCEIVEKLGQPQPTVSRHLNHLKRIGILASERRGTWMWYQLEPNMPKWCQVIIKQLPDS